jgi:plastocyanin
MRLSAILLAPLLILLAMGIQSPPAAGEPKYRSNRLTPSFIKDFHFVPERLEISASDTVIWKNPDIVPHTAIEKKGLRFEEPRQWRILEVSRSGKKRGVSLIAAHITYYAGRTVH